MSLSRSMWFHSTSFALSRECLILMVLNCFNVYVLPSCDTLWSIEIVNIVFYVHTNSRGVYG